MNQDILKQLLSKLSDIEARLQVVEKFNNTSVEDLMKFTGYGSGYVPKCGSTSIYPNDYCHADFIKASYPTYQSVVYCECDKCSKVRKPKDFK